MLAMNVIASIVVLGVVLTGPARRALAGGVSHFLGRISFALYLVHVLVICSFSSALYVALVDVLPYGLLVAVVGGLSVGVTICAAYGFTLVVEEGVLPWLKRPIYRSVRSSVLRILP